MKNVIYLVFIVICFAQFSCAPRIGYSSGSERYSDSYSSRSAGRSSESSTVNSQLSETQTNNFSGFYVGLEFTDVDITEKFGVQPGIDFIYSSDWKMFQTPILASYEIFDGFRVLAGPNLTLLVDAPDGLSSFGFSIDGGVSYELFENFAIEARYDYGLTDYSENDFFEVKLSQFQIGAAYRFGR